MFAYVMAAMRSLIRSDHAQDAFEYMLVIGGVSVAVIVAVATPVGGSIIDAVVDGACAAIETIPNIGPVLNCPA